MFFAVRLRPGAPHAQAREQAEAISDRFCEGLRTHIAAPPERTRPFYLSSSRWNRCGIAATTERSAREPVARPDTAIKVK
jgi:hypothetical protein